MIEWFTIHSVVYQNLHQFPNLHKNDMKNRQWQSFELCTARHIASHTAPNFFAQCQIYISGGCKYAIQEWIFTFAELSLPKTAEKLDAGSRRLGTVCRLRYNYLIVIPWEWLSVFCSRIPLSNDTSNRCSNLGCNMMRIQMWGNHLVTMSRQYFFLTLCKKSSP